MNYVIGNWLRFMSLLSGIYHIAKESLLHPLKSSFILETPSGYVSLGPGANLTGIKIENYALRGIELKDADLKNATFINCDLRDVDLSVAKNVETATFKNTLGRSDTIKPQENPA